MADRELSEADSYENEEICNDAASPDHVSDEDEDEDGDKPASAADPGVDVHLAQLGFAEREASMPLIARFFPSKVGGIPVRVVLP